LGVVKTGVLRRTDFGVNEQNPDIINRRRQALIPKMHGEKRKDNRAFINYDKLYINSVEYRLPPDGPMMRFPQPGNPEPHMRFPSRRNPDNHYQ
jgi:hypothetical protein